ncbi:hypothetical protein [Streptomyces sp. TRM70350]|uniref:hypothetical protein n=1 Tax=Streptomyces sp. TRM70350 TaxID=2856165 RepID=UPI001C472463|nr:hypothetical protein [Streptomyces sp. TRM70350]MBV7698616.1 hypothetical protein [Streptomyces sp. TRM70350]
MILEELGLRAPGLLLETFIEGAVLVGIRAGTGYVLEGDAGPAVRLARVAGGHHGRFPQLEVRGAASSGRVQADPGGQAGQRIRYRYAAQLRHLTGAEALPPHVSETAAVLMTGLVDCLVMRADASPPTSSAANSMPARSLHDQVGNSKVPAQYRPI